MEVAGITSDFLGVTKATLGTTDWSGHSRFFADDEIILNKLDNIIFKLFDRIFYQTAFPTKIFLVVFGIMHIQALFGNNFFSVDNFYKVMVMIFEITKTDKMNPAQFNEFGYTFFGITIVTWILFMVLALILYKRKYISSIPLTVLSFLIYIINPLLLNPTSYLIKRLLILTLMISSYRKDPNNPIHTNFLKYYCNEDFINYKDSISDKNVSLFILLLVLLAIAFILQVIMILLSFRLLASTPFIPYHGLTGLSMTCINYQIFLRPIIRILESFFGFYPRWSTIVLYSVSIVLYLLLIYFIFLYPVIHSVTTALMFGYAIAGTIGSIIKLAYSEVMDGVYYPHYIAILLSYFVSSLAVFLIYSVYLKKKYMPLLAYNGEVNIVDTPSDKRSSLLILSTAERDEIIKQRVFEDEKLQVIPYSKKVSFSFVRIMSRLKLLLLIKVGIENGCDMFIDYTLFKFIISTFSDDREILKLLSILEMAFPYMRYYFPNLLPIIRVDAMKFNQRFLIYEINTLNKLTETELSTSSNQEMSIVRSNSSKYQDIIMNTWLLDKITLSSLENIMSIIKKGDTMFNWIFEKYPNLKEARSLYLQYCVECKADFYQSEITKRQIKKIEEHKLSIKDKSFVSFVRTFPVYLTHNIITPNGFIPDFSNSETQYKENSESSIENISSLSEPTDYESKLRYAIFKSTNKLRACSSFFLQTLIYVFFLAFFIAEIAFTFAYYGNFSSEMQNTDILKYYRHLAANLSLADAFVLLKYGTMYTNHSIQYNVLNKTERLGGILTKPGGSVSDSSYRFNFFDYYNRFDQTGVYFDTREETLNFNIIFRALCTAKSFQLLFSELKELNLNTFFDVQSVEQMMFFDPMQPRFCYQGAKLDPIPLNFERTLIEHSFNQIDLSYRKNMQYWLINDNSFCNIFSTFQPIMNRLKIVRNETYVIFMQTNRDKRSQTLLIAIVIPLIITVVNLVFFFIAVFRYKKELKCFADILSSLDEEVKRNGASPILLQSTMNRSTGLSTTNNGITIDKNASPTKFGSKKFLYMSLLTLCILFIVIQGVFVFSIGYIAYQMKSYDLIVTYWSFYNKLKIPQYIEMFDALSLTCILRTHQTNSTTYSEERERCFNIIKEAETSDTYLVTTSDNGPSILGHLDLFDDFYLRSTCYFNDEVVSDTFSHKGPLPDKNLLADDDDPFEWLDDQSVMYSDAEFECMSLSNKMLIYIQITRDVLQKLGKDITTHSLNDYIVSRIAYLYYIFNKYLLNDINICNVLITEMGDRFLSESQRNIILLFVASVIVSIITFFVCIYFKNFMDSVYKGGLILVRRLQPNEMAANHRLVSFLLNKGISKKNINKEMNVTQSIVHYSSDMLLYASSNGIVLLTNQAITQNLSFSPEQIVGKPLYSLFEEESKKEIQRQISIIEKDENQGMAQLNVTCYTATMSTLYVSLTMFQTSSNHIVVIMKNLTDILEKQRIAQQMRNNCIALYYNILPSFVAKLNNEEKDISFLVPTATIIFVDIDRFCEFSRPLSPEQLLGVLSSIYNQYDCKLREYSSLTKIKIIGDILMVAGGLFNNQLDYNKSLQQTSSSNMSMIGISHSKSKETPDKFAKGTKLGSSIIGYSNTIDLPPLVSSSQSTVNTSSHSDHGITLINSNHSDYIQHPNQDTAFTDVESTPMQDQVMSQASIARLDSDYMAPDAFVASQAVRFGFDCIEVVEDINMKNNFNLAIRVGISTGGPIIAGVLGEDKLDFEIFGEEISFASKIQNTGIPGQIVISDSTYNLISNLQFPFEDREIYIKGKGNICTHIVHPV